jgi:TM2 domain-containing membrane protein YozV
LLTGVFWGIVGAIFLVFGILTISREDEEKGAAISGSLAATVVGGIGIFAALYSDWALGVLTGNLAGEPSEDTRILYWIYFVAKRLPLLTS